MKVCGVEIKSNEAIISLLSLTDGVFNIPDCRARKFTYTNINSQEALIAFQKEFAKLVEDYSIDKVVFRQRPPKGKFAGGAVGFKMEAAIELISNLEVHSLTNTEIKTLIKHNPLPVPFAETGLKAFQEGAFSTAYAFLSHSTNQDA